jgi:hypothetical protein
VARSFDVDRIRQQRFDPGDINAFMPNAEKIRVKATTIADSRMDAWVENIRSLNGLTPPVSDSRCRPYWVMGDREGELRVVVARVKSPSR